MFQGICNPPDEIREATFRITATQPDESAAAAAAAGADSAPVSVGVSGERGAAAGGDRRRREWQVLALLPVRIFGGVERRQRER